MTILTCADCGQPLTTGIAETLVETDRGPVHPDCYEAERRLDHGDPPLPPDRADGFSNENV